jgi:hypothetical protein
MPRRLRKLSTIPLALLAIFALGACGDSHSKVTTGTYAGESGKNAPYLDVGPLKYQVQISRQLNPFNNEDSAYLQGLAPAQRQLAPGQEWFGVFIQVFNVGPKPALAATSLTVSDTQRNVYLPIVPGPANLYAYRGGLVSAEGGRIPEPGSSAANGGTQGALLLYKIQVSSLDNRPLQLKIINPYDLAESASAELDV